MKKIWFRVGMEANISDKELEMLEIYGNEKIDTEVDMERINDMMKNIIAKGKLSGETYIVGKEECGLSDDYDNPEKEIDFLF